MNAAQVSDVWRRLFRRSFNVSYQRIAFEKVRRLGNAAMTFQPGITVIVGGNGVGKSTLMATLIRSLGPAPNSQSADLFTIDGVRIEGTVRNEPAHAVLTTSISGEGIAVDPANVQPPVHQWIDPSTVAARVQSLIHEDADFSANLEGIDPTDLNAKELATLSYIVGKLYTKVAVFEIEFDKMGSVPYFKVVSGNVEYDSAQMGLGELSIFHVYWQLRNVGADSIVLMEEPETHVSPRSQECLADVCADFCVRKGISLIVTTHSPFFIEKLPKENLRLLFRDGEGIGIVEAPTHDQVARVLGDRLNYHGVVVVEDDLSKWVLRVILRRLAPELLEYYEVVAAQAVDTLKGCLSTLPILKNWFSLVGVFDADQRPSLVGVAFPWPHLFLPGTGAPEDLLRQTIESSRVDVAASLGCGLERLNVGLEAAVGFEKHEWIRQLRQSLGLELPTLVDGVLEVFLSDANHAAACGELIGGLSSKAFLIQRWRP